MNALMLNFKQVQTELAARKLVFWQAHSYQSVVKSLNIKNKSILLQFLYFLISQSFLWNRHPNKYSHECCLENKDKLFLCFLTQIFAPSLGWDNPMKHLIRSCVDALKAYLHTQFTIQRFLQYYFQCSQNVTSGSCNISQ